MIIWDLSNIYGGDVRYLRSRFPDGQPHLQVLNRKDLRPDNGPIEIITNIRSAEDVLELGMALDIVRRWSGFEQVGLTIGYLMGARMDRAIDDTQPLTLKVILAFLRSVVGVFETVRVLDVHSDIGAAIFAPKVLERLQPTRLWTRAISGMTPLTGSRRRLYRRMKAPYCVTGSWTHPG